MKGRIAGGGFFTGGTM